MTLGEKIRNLRKRSGMSQEKLAELMGISRQSVAKWESGQSSPSSANLFKLADILGTTTVSLLASEDESPGEETSGALGDGKSSQTEQDEKFEKAGESSGSGSNSRQSDGLPRDSISSQAEEIYRVFKAEDEKNKKEKKDIIRKNVLSALFILLAYMVLYMIGRLIWCRSGGESSMLGILWASKPEGENSYLFGWLLSSRLFYISAVISAIPSLLGRRYFSIITLAGFIISMVSGIIFGPNPEGAFYGNSHYGWAIWAGIFILSMALGILFEVHKAIKPLKRKGRH